MKIFKHILLAAAAVAAIACSEEISPEPIGKPGSNLISMTFTANSDTGVDSKIMYDGESKTTQWKTGDVITIVSESGFASEFEAVSVSDDGKTAEFQGKTEASDKYYAVYPSTAYKGNDFDAPVTADNPRLYVNVPEVQTAVAGTFDPKAFVSIATNRGSNLSFKNLCSVVKFNLNDASGVKSIRFCMTSNTNLAGTGSVHIKSTTTHSWGEDIKVNGTSIRYSSNMITLNAPAAGFDNNTDYYFVQRVYEQSKDTDKPDGVQFYLEYEDHVKTRTGVNAFDASRNKVVPVGTIDEDDKVQDLTPYEAYDLGFDIVIGGIVINKKTYPTATYIKSNSSSKSIGNKGLYFVDSDVEATFGSNISDLVVVGNDQSKRTKISRSGESYLTGTSNQDNLILKNIYYNSPVSNHAFRFNANETFENIIFDNCYFAIPTAVSSNQYSLLTLNGKSFKNFNMKSCDCLFSNTSMLINCGGTSTSIESIVFQNNVFYGNETVTGTALINGSAQTINKTILSNNTLYKMVSQNNGFIYAKNLEQLSITYNLFYHCINSNTSHSYIFNLNAGTLGSSEVKNNSSATAVGENKRVYASKTSYSSVENPGNTNFSYNISNWNPEESVFEIDGTNGNNYYGATR